MTVLGWIVGLGLLGLIIYRLATAKNRRVKAAFYRVVRVCDCGGTRRYSGMVGDNVEDNCNVCVRTRITNVADILDHDCLASDMVPLGEAWVKDDVEVREFRCNICGEKHTSWYGIMDTALGGF